jgi:acyl dehydratase
MSEPIPPPTDSQERGVSDNELIEGLPIGQVDYSRRRTISEGDFSVLTNMTWTTGPIHSDEEYARTTPFGHRILGGPVVAAVVSGMWYSSCCEEFYARNRIRSIAALGMNASYRGPLFPGDTLRAETTLVNARPSKTRPGTGILEFQDRAYNQRDELVIEMKRAILFERISE